MKTRKYRNKPVVVEAVQWDGSPEEADRIVEWIRDGGRLAKYECQTILAETRGGRRYCLPKCWVVQEGGGFYIYGPGLFEAKHELVEGEGHERA